MNLFKFNFLGSSSTDTELPDIFPMPIIMANFVAIDVRNLYSKILTDVFERTEGITDDQQNLLWDNCLASEKQDGLITMVSKAMADKADLFLVYDKALKVIRLADAKEVEQIKAEYKLKGESQAGMYITFRNYSRTDMIKFYSQLEYCSVGSLWKSANISKALQLKMTDLRSSVGMTDSADVKVQAQAIAKGLGQGKDVMTDAKDIIETAKPDLTAATSMNEFIAKKQSLYTGLPASYLTGEQTGGLGDSGNADTKATERGLRAYYFSIAKPLVEGMFGVTTKFKSDDFDGLSTSLEALKTFDITSDQYLSKKNKTLIVNRSFGLPDDEDGDEVEAVTAPTEVPATV